LQHSKETAICTYPKPDQSISLSQSSYWNLLILFSRLRLEVPSGFFPQVSPPNLYVPLPHTCYMPANLIPFFILSLNNIFWGQKINLFLNKSSPLLCYLVHLRPEYLHQNSVLENSQLMLPQPEKQSFTPVQNADKIILIRIWIFTFLDRKLSDRFCTEWWEAFRTSACFIFLLLWLTL